MREKRNLLSSNFLNQLGQLKIIQKSKGYLSETGAYQSKNSGGMNDFLEHKSYQSGDEPRFIDWNIYGRLNKLAVKVFSKKENNHHFFMIDASASMSFTNNSKIDKACQLCAAISYLTLNQDDILHFYWQNHSVNQRLNIHGSKAIIPTLNFLSDIKATGKAPLNNALKRLHQSKLKRGHVIIFSDFYDTEGLFETIAQLQKRRLSFTFFHLLSLEEMKFSESGKMVLLDSEKLNSENFVINKKVSQQYSQCLSQFTEDLNQKSHSMNIDFYSINADSSFQDSIHQLRQHHFFG